MSGLAWLDWGIASLSLINALILLWLGLTVLLNAQRRTWGIYLASVGLLIGSVFFLTHLFITSRGLESIYFEQLNRWQILLLPIVFLPFLWYILMLWYGGFWESRSSDLNGYHRYGVAASFSLLVLVIGLFVVSSIGYPDSAWERLVFKRGPLIFGFPLVFTLYSLYLVLCMSLSIMALRYPGPSRRFMGKLARQRAQPWLMKAALTLLLVSVFVIFGLIWLTLRPLTRELELDFLRAIGWMDLVISALITIAVGMLGQAITSYEVFTGRSLPRRGLLRQWYRVLFLAVGLGVTVGWSIAFRLPSIYIAVLTTVLVSVFYALLSWRAFAERQRYMQHLRPFVSSQGLSDHLLMPGSAVSSEVDVQTPFQALCREVLGAQLAYLIATGPLSSLIGPPLVYNRKAVPDLSCVSAITGWFQTPETLYLPLEPIDHEGASLGVSLWSERGLIGVLLLGDKVDGGLYTQEEIEIARASGERLIDTQTSVEIARSLMSIQRQRFLHNQVLDRHTRRALHDEVLPRLHSVILNLQQLGMDPGNPVGEALTDLSDLHRTIADLLPSHPGISASDVARLGLISALRRVVNAEMASFFDEVVFAVAPMAEREVDAIPNLTAEVVFYACCEVIRNAAKHGRDSHSRDPFCLQVDVAWSDGLVIVIQDNGVGIAEVCEKRDRGGHGLAFHSMLMSIVGGSLVVDSAAHEFTSVTLELPKNQAL